MAPDVLAVELWLIVAPLTVRLKRVVVFPMAPEKVATPEVPACTVSAVVAATVPSSVLEKLMFAPAAVPPALVESIVRVAPATTAGPVIAIAPPLVVRLPFTLVAVEPV